MSPTGQARRPYDAGGRRAQARANQERMLAAARELFLARGYAATSVAEIAAAAGVSGPTVYAAFGSKAALLKRAVETALVGDVQPVPLAERPAMRHVRAGGTAEEVLRRFAALVAERAPTVCPLAAVLEAAADAEPEAARLAAALDAERLAGADALAAVVAERLGEPQRRAALRDLIWTMNSPQLYRLLVEQRGWPLDRYGDWIARTLVAELGHAPGRPPG